MQSSAVERRGQAAYCDSSFCSSDAFVAAPAPAPAPARASSPRAAASAEPASVVLGVLCCDSHEFVDAEDARPPTTLPPPTYVHTYTLAVVIPYTDNVKETRSTSIVPLCPKMFLLLLVNSRLYADKWSLRTISNIIYPAILST
ncbi:unnamed protein product [Chrysodeixis includens]|uniref:Uncharacterized protein n=1 Tax=Chrysodeixis includens TaxID=689277 RepID=A0A9N8PX48_CHRIL|nr:unnamed protein product [Chrysodeixis includens]